MHPLRLPLLGAIALSVLTAACGDDPTKEPAPPMEPSPDGDAGTDSALTCAAEPLPLQNARAHVLGETFYLPAVLDRDDCLDLKWAVVSAPQGSANAVHMRAPQPSFTPDLPGDYAFRLGGADGSEFSLRVVARSPAERFRNHYLTPLYGAARVGRELWTANGASYTVSRAVREANGSWRKAGDVTVGAWPAALAYREPMQHVLVAQRGSDTVGFIDRARGVLEDALWVGDEPSGLALSPDAQRLYVSLSTMGQVAVVDVERREVIERIEVGFDPRALALSEDGVRLFVASYRSGNRVKDTRGEYTADDDRDIQIVNTATLEVETVVEGVSADLRAIALSDDGAELFVAGTDGDPEPSQAEEGAKPFVHEVVVVGADPARPDYGKVRRRADMTRQESSGGPFVNPAGVLAVGDTVWVASESSDQVVALDRATLAEKARVTVGQGARHLVALDDDSVAVHCFQTFDAWVLDADGQVRATIALTDDPRPADVALGERVFTRPGANFAQNHACSSCHVETQNDGMVWRFGPSSWHNVRPLQLLAATTPLEWGAYVSSVDNFGYQGPASIVSRPATPEEALGMAGFLGSLIGAPRATGHTRPDGSYSEAALRGKALFEGKATCASCHVPPLYTSRAYVPKGKSGEPADVPSLLGAYRHGVYLVNGRARSLEGAVDVALGFVGASLTDNERADLLRFLRELTPKGSAPLGIWPDLESSEGVYPDVRPWVAFADPVDDAVPGKSAAQLAAEFVVLEDAQGKRVAGSVQLEGGRIAFVPDAALTAGARYTFRALAGLPFASGGKLEGARSSSFTVAQPATGTWPGAMSMTVSVPGGPPGSPPPPPTPFVLEPVATPQPGGLTLRIVPQVFGAQQRQEVWARLDGSTFRMQPFALPAGPQGVADAMQVVGEVKEVDPDTKAVLRIEGTLRVAGPGISLPGVPFVITPQ